MDNIDYVANFNKFNDIKYCCYNFKFVDLGGKNDSRRN